jgi:hypothetical protein
MDNLTHCYMCGKELEVASRELAEPLPGFAAEKVKLVCRPCKLDFDETWHASDLAEARYRAAREAVSLLGSPARASAWLDHPSRAAGGVTPRRLLETAEGTSKAWDLLDALEEVDQEERARRMALAKVRFDEWVVRWSISPGMIDRDPRSAERVREGNVPRSTPGEPLYSGYEGWVGPGWLPLLERLAADLAALGWNRDLHQLKEKLGGLRFYTGRATQEINDRIEQAEKESFTICEHCGAPGRPREGRTAWIKTTCDACLKTELERPSFE